MFSPALRLGKRVVLCARERGFPEIATISGRRNRIVLSVDDSERSAHRSTVPTAALRVRSG